MLFRDRPSAAPGGNVGRLAARLNGGDDINGEPALQDTARGMRQSKHGRHGRYPRTGRKGESLRERRSDTNPRKRSRTRTERNAR